MVGRQQDSRHRPHTLRQAIGLITQKAAAGLVQPAGALLEEVMIAEQGAELAKDGSRRGRHEQGGQGAMVEAQLAREGQGDSSSSLRCGWEQKLLLQPDVPQQPSAESLVGVLIQAAGTGIHLRQQLLQATVILEQ